MSTGTQLRRWLDAMTGLLVLTLAAAGTSAAFAGTEVVPAGPLLSTGPIGYQFAVYLPEKSAASPMEALRQALKATAGAPALAQKIDQAPASPVVMATLNEQAATTYAPPDVSQIQRFGHGLSKEQAAALARSRAALLMDFVHPSSQRIGAYRNSLLIAERVARATGGILWDEETREVFTPDAWRSRRIETWDRDIPDVSQQIVVHAYLSDPQVRAISLGMGKFGAPDAVIENFPWSSNARMGNLINAMVQLSAEGALAGAKGQFDLDFDAIRHARVRQSLKELLLPNAKAKAPLLLVKGTPRRVRLSPARRVRKVGRQRDRKDHREDAMTDRHDDRAGHGAPVSVGE